MTHRRIVRVLLAVVAVHFVRTSAIGHNIAVRVGSNTGAAVARYLIDAYELNAKGSEPTADDAYRDMKNSVEVSNEPFRLVFAILSLPTKSLIEPMFRPMTRRWFEELLSDKLSRAQLRARLFALEIVENLVNSISLGLLLYLGLRMVMVVRAP